MRSHSLPRLSGLWLILLLLSSASQAETLRIAVASNFSDAVRPLARQFEADSGHRVQLIFGSTGKHFAQIVNGAPFDAFLAADRRRPELLEQQGRAIAGSRFTYAIGQLVLWSPNPDGGDLQQQLKQGRFRHLAIANPKLAPYGRAAWQLLDKLNLQSSVRGKLVRGENIGQTFHFVSSGNAELGLVALSQITDPQQPLPGRHWLVNPSLYEPIVQQAVQLNRSPAIDAFMNFLRSDNVTQLIRQHGYAIPEGR
ncbi:molybdate ABC transporter substrate-binding protein [Motiliproteus coralliicola]|uniref:Molybdate ABC transporter substrate-binding protein n=1 Tax=Motiliproteus coralliicola TaxID=2283196 RepID=A0A369WC48_9GAMM|nr:molybdate ABC transporter substrate-binding protein [Motiliproteus coralliicola]RDE18274.1 molybdate ABC transporter substrate-binding protein [Motiliproteus coralliicola]